MGRNKRRLSPPEAYVDFVPGVDHVERRDGRVYLVDGTGWLADHEVYPDEIVEFPGFVERVRAEASLVRLRWCVRRVARYAFLSEEGRAERLGAIAARIVELTGRCTFEVIPLIDGGDMGICSRAHEQGYRDPPPTAAAPAPPAAPSDGSRMSPGRLADALHRIGEDVAKIQLRLRSLAPFLGGREPGADGRLEIVHDSLREQACMLVDLATAVRLGEVPIAAFGADKAEQLPLFPGEPDPPEKPKRRRKAKAPEPDEGEPVT